MKYLLPWKEWGLHYWRPALGNENPLPFASICRVVAYHRYSDTGLGATGRYWSTDDGKTKFDNPLDAKNAKDEEMRAAGYYLIPEDKVEAFREKLAVLL